MSINTKNLLLLLPVLPVIALALPVRAWADVTVHEQTTLNAGILNAQGTSTQQIAGNRQRTESELRCNGMMSHLCDKDQRIDIVRLDRNVIWRFEPKSQGYTEASLPTPELRRAAAEHLRAAVEKLNSCPQTQRAAAVIDTSRCELSAPSLTVNQTNEVANIAGHDTQRTNLKLSQKCSSHESGQPCELIYSFDVWLAVDEIRGLEDRRAFQRRYLTQLGLPSTFVATSTQLEQYLAAYAAAMQQLSDKAAELKGYPLKTTFRLQHTGAPCGTTAAATATGSGEALSSAGQAAVSATSSSSEHAAGWSTADAVERQTGSGIGGYIAGSAAGAFTGKLVGGLFAKRPKAEPAKPVPKPVPTSGQR